MFSCVHIWGDIPTYLQTVNVMSTGLDYVKMCLSERIETAFSFSRKPPFSQVRLALFLKTCHVSLGNFTVNYLGRLLKHVDPFKITFEHTYAPLLTIPLCFLFKRKRFSILLKKITIHFRYFRNHFWRK